MHTTELEDPGDDEPLIDVREEGDAGHGDKPSPVGETEQRPEIEAEFRAWAGLADQERLAGLREVMAGWRSVGPEVLIRLCCWAYEHAGRELFNLAFGALCKSETPKLLKQAWGLSPEDRNDQVQEILLSVLEAIQKGKAAYAATYFASFTKRQSISLHRKRAARFEGAYQRMEPEEEKDPLDLVPARTPSPEAKALLITQLRKLPEKYRTVIIQRHLMEMTQKQIATHHNVSVRTVYTLLKEAELAAGLTGE